MQTKISRSGQTAATILLVGLLVGLLYWNALDGGFVFDDQDLVLESGRAQGMVPLAKFYRFFLSPERGFAYRPLRTLSYLVDYTLFGLSPKGFHAANLFYHALNTCLAFVVARRLLGRSRAALMVALLFAAHPIQTEAVAYISGRRDLLSTLFVFLGVWAFLRRRDHGNRGGLGLIVAALLMGLLSKEMAITLPLLLLAYDAVHQVPLRPGVSSLQTLAALLRAIPGCLAKDRPLYLPLLVLAGAFSVIAVFFSQAAGEHQYYGGGLGLTLLTSARIVTHYLKLLFFPLTLNADYSFDAFPISESFFEPAALLALLLLAAILFGLLALLPREPMGVFGGGWFFLTLLPVSQIIPHHELMAEHYLYLPSFGFFLMAGHFANRLLEGKRAGTALYGAYAIVFLLLSARTIVRNRDWRNELTLWQKTAQTAPRSARARANLGVAYLSRGQLGLAEQELEEAVRIAPGDGRHRERLGQVLLQMGRLEAAEAQVDEALRMLPSRSSLHRTLGLVYLRQHRLEDAEWQFREAARLSNLRPLLPQPEPFIRLAQVAVARGQFERAQEELLKALRQMPKGLARQGPIEEAWRELREALLRWSDRQEAQQLLEQMERAHPEAAASPPSRPLSD